MFWINKPDRVARMEADNDDFFFFSPTDKYMDNSSKRFINTWKCTIRKLDHGRTSNLKMARSDYGPRQSFQHVEIKITRLAIAINSHPQINLWNKSLKLKKCDQSLAKKRLDGSNSVCGSSVINADLTACKDHEPTVETKKYLRDAGPLRFIADTTHPGISHIVNVLGRHLHSPSKRNVDALKLIHHPVPV